MGGKWWACTRVGFVSHALGAATQQLALPSLKTHAIGIVEEGVGANSVDGAGQNTGLQAAAQQRRDGERGQIACRCGDAEDIVAAVGDVELAGAISDDAPRRVEVGRRGRAVVVKGESVADRRRGARGGIDAAQLVVAAVGQPEEARYGIPGDALRREEERRHAAGIRAAARAAVEGAAAGQRGDEAAGDDNLAHIVVADFGHVEEEAGGVGGHADGA